MLRDVDVAASVTSLSLYMGPGILNGADPSLSFSLISIPFDLF
jgi:hypothetical protein